jgi:hypothetical protein
MRDKMMFNFGIADVGDPSRSYNAYSPQKILASTVRAPTLATALQRRPRSYADDARSFDARAMGGRAAMPVCGSLATPQ